MRTFDYKKIYLKLLTPEIVAYVTKIHELKGKQELFAKSSEDVLEDLVEVAKIQSTEASNRIEGIITTDERIRKIVNEKTMPKSRSEKEIAGYRDVLATVHESFAYIPPKPAMILQLHRDLYKYAGATEGGVYKLADNVIKETYKDGTEKIRFRPVDAWAVSEVMNQICDAFEEAMKDQAIDPLILIPVYVLDFLCIHPFSDGNGRMSRLLTLLLLYRSGFMVGKYISIEKLISDTKDTYYEALQESSARWHEGENEYESFVKYMLSVILAAYREFSSRADVLSETELSKPSKVREVIKNTTGKITKTEIMKKCPDISQTTIQRTLIDLVRADEIIKIGGGRYTSYAWNWEA